MLIFENGNWDCVDIFSELWNYMTCSEVFQDLLYEMY